MEGRVLLIEDHPINRKVLRERFEESDMKVDEALTGEEGLKLAARLLPQVIIISNSLPDMEGGEVAKRLREKTRTRHIFLMLLADENVHRQRLTSLELGVDDFIASPFDPDEVRLRVRNALRRANNSNLMDPTTGLPAGSLVQDQLRRLLKDPEGQWALLRVHVIALEAFREVHGFQAAGDMLRGVAAILAESLAHDDVQDDFLGYVGRDDFIAITHKTRAQSMREEVVAKFQQEIGTHYDFLERDQGFILVDGERAPLASLRIRSITPADGPFYDVRSLSEALSG